MFLRVSAMRPTVSADPEGPFEARDYSLVNWAGCEWKTPAPETWEAIKKAATTAGTLISLRNWSTDSISTSPQKWNRTRLKRPTQRTSEPNCHHRLPLTRQNPIGNHSAGDCQQREDGYDRNGLHMVNVASDCGRKGQSFVPFRDNGGK